MDIFRRIWGAYKTVSQGTFSVLERGFALF
ncbi:hypothetical protein TSAR_011690 [Trichomalopsis sarcophagae]|uniref:Uncharacterized protein n=1 Tax=Trichomalopsis sarcophagae TaxID=543379 RepID=A0A232EJC8_9HYME|nr:hypothetical protein TSAR_011690 [Trichomalopsis sarcophagae]